MEADNLENDRRIEEENKRQDRLWRLQEEAVASGKANAAVEMRWNDLMEHNMPQDLNRVSARAVWQPTTPHARGWESEAVVRA